MITATSGSDIRLSGRFVPPEGSSIDLTGYNLTALVDSASALSGRVSVSWTDQSAGEFQVFIEGSSPIRVGLYGFRVQADGSGLDGFATPEIRVKII